MTGLRTPHLMRDHPGTATTVMDAFWVVALGVIVAYTFFAALGAYSPGEILGVTIAVAALAGLWVVHGWESSRHRDEGRDRRLTEARERRGF
jgi:hypothetical protein